MTHPTAKELSSIYARAWILAPLSKPAEQVFDLLGPDGEWECGCRFPGSKFCEEKHWLETAVLTKVCRMAAIEWLRSKGKVVLSPRFDGAYPEDAEYVKITLPEPLDELMRQPVYLRTGPTLDHALAAAVIAVGGGK